MCFRQDVASEVETLVRIGIEASYLLFPKKSGVENYTFHLIEALGQLPDLPEITLYLHPPPEPDWSPEVEALLANHKFRRRVSRVPRGWLKLVLPYQAWWDRTEVVHFPGTLLPPMLLCASVITLYDLTYVRMPELYPPQELAIAETAVAQAAQKATAIIAVSENTKRDLIEIYDVEEEKIQAIPLGVEPRFCPQEGAPCTALVQGTPCTALVQGAQERVEAEFGLSDPFLLYVGNLQLRKNLVRLIQAFDQTGLAEHRLVLAGKAGWRAEEVFAAAANASDPDRIIFLDYVPPEQLPWLYRAAQAFVFPSLYEGFGLPVLEAMACGTPVIASDTSSLPEVVGEAGILLDPYDTGAWSDAMLRLTRDSGLRDELRQKGLEQAKKFSWRSTAEKTLRVYRLVGGLS